MRWSATVAKPIQRQGRARKVPEPISIGSWGLIRLLQSLLRCQPLRHRESGIWPITTAPDGLFGFTPP
jgi:hypothetical protein